MASILAATQLIGFAFQAFQGCIEAYQFCRRAQRIGSDADPLRTKLQYEQCRLDDWAVRSGLKTSQPNKRLNWGLIYDILQQQNILLTSAEHLKLKYNLDVPEVDLDGDTEEVEETSKSPRKGLDRLFASQRPELDTQAARLIKAKNSPLKRVQWASVGKETISKVITELREFNTYLVELLDTAERDKFRDEQQFLLRTMLSMATDLPEVDGIGELLRTNASADEEQLGAVAACKRLRLFMRADQRSDEIEVKGTAGVANSMPAFRSLSTDKFIKGVRASSGHVDTGTYKNISVLVEWRQVDASKFEQMRGHMKNLSVLLGNVDWSFAALPCIGLLTYKDQCRYGLVYEMPVTIDLPSLQSVDRSLFDLILTSTRASLANRISIATQLAQALLQLHTAGWVHKSIRSENVLFISAEGSDAEHFLSSHPYLIGYDYARPDAAKSLTEQPKSSLTADLYRHPDKRGSASLFYRKRHDFYALACLLVELAMWEPLARTFSRDAEKDWESAIRAADADKKDLQLPSLLDVIELPGFREQITHHAGPRYLGAVESCLVPISASTYDEDVLLDVQKSVVDKLRGCKV